MNYKLCGHHQKQLTADPYRANKDTNSARQCSLAHMFEIVSVASRAKRSLRQAKFVGSSPHIRSRTTWYGKYFTAFGKILSLEVFKCSFFSIISIKTFFGQRSWSAMDKARNQPVPKRILRIVQVSPRIKAYSSLVIRTAQRFSSPTRTTLLSLQER